MANIAVVILTVDSNLVFAPQSGNYPSLRTDFVGTNNVPGTDHAGVGLRPLAAWTPFQDSCHPPSRNFNMLSYISFAALCTGIAHSFSLNISMEKYPR